MQVKKGGRLDLALITLIYIVYQLPDSLTLIHPYCGPAECRAPNQVGN